MEVLDMTPRFRVLKNGNGLISGVPATDLRSILVAAALYRHEHKYKPEPIPEQEEYHGQRKILERNARASKEWHRTQRWILDQLEESLDAPRRAKYCQDTRTLKERLRDNQNQRIMIREIIAEEIKRRKEQAK